MWLLEHDGDVFQGKRLWLRPGKKFIFGRTSDKSGGFVIENKTISRKHLIIEVDDVKPGDCLKPNTRSQVTLEDLNTKIGTLVDGTQIRGRRHALEGLRHEIKLGQYDKVFRITWYPVVLSFSFASKELKSNPLQSFCKKVEALDIKVHLDYIRESTTHVVSKKRNTSKGLQALINGRYIVDYTFIDAVEAAAEATEEQVSLLESDFNSNWPNELQFLPPRGAEPTQRSSDAYSPDPRRQDIFEGYTFIFFDQAQFDNLLAPVTDGRGKALLRHVDPFKTDVEDFVRYVKDVAGEKRLGEFEDGSEGKGVVVVRYQPAKGPTLDWYANFGRQVALHLDHRLIEQREFLDAILSNDARVLRKPLEVEESGIVAPPPTAATITNLRAPPSTALTSTMVGDETAAEQLPESSVSAPAPPSRRMGRTRRTVTSRFKGFDDDFDTPILPESNPATYTQPAISQSKDQGLFVSQADSMDIDLQSSQAAATQTRSSWKRPSPPPIAEEDEEDVLDQIAPAAANLKRRRLADEAARRRRGESTPPPPILPPKKTEETKLKRKKVKPEIDVLEVARERREKEEAIAIAEREALQEAMEGMDIEQIRNLAVIEEMEVKRTVPPRRASAQGDEANDRWDERWNGRKNFKNFRRRGELASRLISKVIVPLEEVKKKDFGIGDEYWLEGDRDSQRKKKGKSRARESQAVDNTQSQTQAPRRQTPQTVVIDEVEVVDTSPRSQRASTRSQKSTTTTIMPSSQSTQNKRAAEPLTKPAPAKKARQATKIMKKQDSDDSDDGLGFRFRKKK